MTTVSQPIVTVSQLFKTYQTKKHAVHALNGVDIEIAAGEKVAIMGASGSGKSTLLHIIGGLDSITFGTVTTAGQQLSTLNDGQISKYRNSRVGFVFQDFNLVEFVSVIDNIAMPLRIAGMIKKEANQKASKLLEELDMTDLRLRYPYELSGGQKQRVAIARAMVGNPLLVLADEPTANLDSANAEVVLKMLVALQLGQDKALVIATHNKDVAERLDRTIYLSDGKVSRSHNMVE